jgi:predicted RNA-binding protein with PIN domain
MSVFSKFRTWWTSNKGHGSSGGPRLYIVDSSALFTRRRGGSRPSPTEQVQLLKKISSFGGKEKLRVRVVLEGRPLREAAEGGTYNGVTVHYADRSSKTADVVVKVLKDGLRRHAVTVITSDRKLEERVLVLGGETMRATTFRKALDGAGGGEEKGSSSQKRRPPRRRRQPKSRDKQEESPDAPIRELIDLVE